MPHFYIHRRTFPKFNLDIHIPFPKKKSTDQHDPLISQEQSGRSNRGFEDLRESTGSTTSMDQESNFAASTSGSKPPVPRQDPRTDLMATATPRGQNVAAKMGIDLFDRKVLQIGNSIHSSREERKRAKEETRQQADAYRQLVGTATFAERR
jgi:hypothetical protein